jgi:hypothetical protein
MEFVYSVGTFDKVVHVWLVHNPGFYELELIDYDTGETLQSRTFEGIEEDAIEEARQWLKTI